MKNTVFIGALGIVACISAAHGSQIWIIPSGQPDLIQGVIDNLAIDGDTIQLEAGDYVLSGDINLRGSAITIQGALNDNGDLLSTIDASSSGRAFTLDSGRTSGSVLRDMKILCGEGILFDVYENGSANNTVGGGILIHNGGTPEVLNCEFFGADTEFGGGIYISRSSPAIVSCMFRNNFAYFRGGAIYHVRSSASIESCIFEGNSSSRDGGAIRNKFSTLSIVASIFRANTTGDDGAAIANEYSAHSLIDESVFEKNIAGDAGGAVYSSSTSWAGISSSRVCENSEPQIYGSWTDEGGNSIGGLCNPCAADFNGDDLVSGQDLGFLLGYWNDEGQFPQIDLNSDGEIDAADLGLLLSAWGPCQ